MIREIDMDTEMPKAVSGSKLPWTTTGSGGLRLQKEGSSIVIYKNKWKPEIWNIACFFDKGDPLFFKGEFASREEAAVHFETGVTS
jgi:hypothetical protein